MADRGFGCGAALSVATPYYAAWRARQYAQRAVHKLAQETTPPAAGPPVGDLESDTQALYQRTLQSFAEGRPVVIDMREAQRRPDVYASLARDITAFSFLDPLTSGFIDARAPYFGESIKTFRDALTRLSKNDARITLVDYDYDGSARESSVTPRELFGTLMRRLFRDARAFEAARSSMSRTDHSLLDTSLRRAAWLLSQGGPQQARDGDTPRRHPGEHVEEIRRHTLQQINQRMAEQLIGESAQDMHAFVSGVQKLKSDPSAFGFIDWLRENPLVAAGVPAIALLTLFGGELGELLGVLGLFGGGYMLYQRYQTLTKDPVAQEAIREYVRRGATPMALRDIERMYGPMYAKACQDFSIAAGSKFLEQQMLKAQAEHQAGFIRRLLSVPVYPVPESNRYQTR